MFPAPIASRLLQGLTTASQQIKRAPGRHAAAMDRLQRMLGASGMGGGGGGGAGDAPQQDTSEQIYISSLALLKMLKHGRAGVPLEVMGLMLGEFVDEYTVKVRLDELLLCGSECGTTCQRWQSGLQVLLGCYAAGMSKTRHWGQAHQHAITPPCRVPTPVS